MNLENVIVIPEDKLIEVVKAAYDLSHPVGMGMLHYREGSLTDEQAKTLIDLDHKRRVVDMDYVVGRCVKMSVFKDEPSGKFFIQKTWYDHSQDDLKQLLDRAGIEYNPSDFE